MIKKICLILLVALLVACKANIKTEENKTKLVNEFVEVLKKGDLSQINQFVNVDTKISIPNPMNLDENAFVVTIFSSLEMVLEIKEDKDYIIVKNYDINQLLKEAQSSVITIEGKDTTRNILNEEQKKAEYLKRLEEAKKSLVKNEIRLKVDFVEDEKKLKFNFEDQETVKLFNASLGIK